MQAAAASSPAIDASVAGEAISRTVQSPVDATAPSGAPDASPPPSEFGPQLEVVLAPPVHTTTSNTTSSTLGMSYNEFCSGGATATASPGSVGDLFAAVNAERARIGSAPLTWNASLAAEAANWSQTMAANQSAHPEYLLTSATGSQLVGTQAWVDDVFHHSGLGPENIDFAYGTNTSPAGAHAAWMKSPGHCENLMYPSYTQFGAGDAWASDSSYFATERFR